jgi:hypothetical protein
MILRETNIKKKKKNWTETIEGIENRDHCQILEKRNGYSRGYKLLLPREK